MLRSIAARARIWRYARLIQRSGLFQPEAYLEQCPADPLARRNPLRHFLLQGAADGLNPNRFFETAYYLERDPELAASGKNPLVHYLRHGAAAGRPTSDRFDTAFYVSRHPDLGVRPTAALAHFLSEGQPAGLPGAPPRPAWLLDLERGLEPTLAVSVPSSGSVPAAMRPKASDARPGRAEPSIGAAPGAVPPGDGGRAARPGGRVLVIGIFLADRENTAVHVAGELARSRAWSVEQRWLALGRSPVPPALAPVTVARARRGPKFALLDQLLQTDLGSYDFVLVTDDDIELPVDFLDRYLTAVQRHDLALAQPARAHGSYVDHPFVEQLDGLRARSTRYVEIGPFFSIRRDAVPLLVPLDRAAPMGWGVDLVWPLRLEAAGRRMGIVDAVPVQHSLRKPVTYYDYESTDRAMRSYLERRPHLSRAEAFTIVEAYRSGGEAGEGAPGPTAAAGEAALPRRRRASGGPELSVVVCTRSADRLRRSLSSLCCQPGANFEVVVVVDGDGPETRTIARSFEGRLSIRCAVQDQAGIACARNLGLFVSVGSAVLFLEEGEVAEPGLLAAHQEAHRAHPAPELAVLGAARLAPALAVDPLLRFALDRGLLAPCGPLRRGDVLDFPFFWPGRCSVKRSLLTSRGVFDHRFRRGDDHAELGFRLARHGFRVLHEDRAVTALAEPYDVDAFCAWLRDRGRSSYLFGKLHPEQVVQRAVGAGPARALWRRLGAVYEAVLGAARALDADARRHVAVLAGGQERALRHAEQGYAAAFALSWVRGMVDQASEDGDDSFGAVAPSEARSVRPNA